MNTKPLGDVTNTFSSRSDMTNMSVAPKLVGNDGVASPSFLHHFCQYMVNYNHSVVALLELRISGHRENEVIQHPMIITVVYASPMVSICNNVWVSLSDLDTGLNSLRIMMGFMVRDSRGRWDPFIKGSIVSWLMRNGYDVIQTPLFFISISWIGSPTDFIETLSVERGADIIGWKDSQKRVFTISRAYEKRSELIVREQVRPWNVLKGSRGLPRVKALLWKLCHGRVLSNAKRVRRHLALDYSCHICGNAVENVEHIFRDYQLVKMAWESLIKPSLLQEFLSLGMVAWFEVNLRNPNRNKIIFDPEIIMGENVVQQSSRLTEEVFHAYRQKVRNIIPQRHVVNRDVVWSKPLGGWIKLNTNSARNPSSGLSTYGVLRDEHAEWIAGFGQILGYCSVIDAELWGLYKDLLLTWNMNHRSIIVESDSKEAIVVLQGEPKIDGISSMASDLPKYYVGTGIGKGTVPPVRRPFKRAVISDQQKRRELSLLRQAQNRCNAQHQARCLASSILSLQSSAPESEPEQSDIEIETVPETEYESENLSKDLDVRRASTLRGPEVRKWFARQLILPEWMIDVPDRLSQDWYVLARPAGKRCFVVSSNGTTVSRQLNGSILHYFPSALPAGAKTRNGSGSAQSYCILDFIFHESDQTYYVIDTVCWNGYSLYDCTVEFRFYWLNSKLEESCACNAPSHYHKFRFSAVSVYNCDQSGLYAAYTGAVPYVKDGLLFYNKHAHYQTGNTLVLVWKDENCSQYAIDTDGKGEIPSQQQVVLELQDDRKLVTSDDPPVLFGCLDGDFIEKSGVQSGNLLRFAIGDGGLSFVDGKLEKADLIYLGKSNRARTFADSYSKVIFQFMVRHSPLKIDDLLASINSPDDQEKIPSDIEMVG
ncbi:uncharacterized protein LOC120159936 [Hibiscus syriacus]|uniref:uncharacterized protein LOC120159936 n=1 Tax=Hibiscus syriacus TaxID=106335 RepID=UPI00192074FB|nr:uncharacterized protein LOC120159936 [Hibiscus syriacus]